MLEPIFVLAPVLFGSGAAVDERLARGPHEIQVNEYGVLVALPEAGLAPLGCPPFLLDRRFAEWFGVEFMVDGVLVTAAASGTVADWAGRAELDPVSLMLEPDAIVAVTRVDTLEIETTISWDPDGPYLLGRAMLINRGSRPVGPVFYTREWKQPGAASWSFPPDFTLSQPLGEEVCRAVWMTDEIPPGSRRGVRFAFHLGEEVAATGEVDVPLTRWRNDDFPTGVNFGATNGISFGDYDADGWIDVFACDSARLWRNLQGESWMLAADLDSVLPNAQVRYGASFGDYNNDGLPDIGTEPRTGGGDTCFNLLKNLGGGPSFVNVATDPEIVDLQPCGAPSEGICWGDVDDDADLDMFLPVYPGHSGGPGNFFLENLGPVGPDGEYVFTETSKEAGLDNPRGTARPEGAQFVDVDFDGDMDLFSNGTLYQNVSIESPSFNPLLRHSSGIGFRSRLDEGAAFFDYDMDGDFDLFIVYSTPGVRIWENLGDGTFFRADDLIDCPFIGLDLGLSAEDWDNDGDIDFTTRNVFRRNMLVETGDRHFTVATDSIPINHKGSATPAWGDWDKDGDLDCALGNWMNFGRFYENTTYDSTTPESEKTHFRVRVVRDDVDFAPGLETEYGAIVELHLEGDPIGVKRKKFVASAAGYLNQNEYTLHFALPAGPNPSAKSSDVVFDVSVDFNGRQDRGLLRIDHHINPALGSIHLADLAQREIVVFRSGRVIVDGDDVAPVVSEKKARLVTTTGGLALPSLVRGVPPTEPAPGPDHYVGISVDAPIDASEPLEVREILLDGQLTDPVDLSLDGGEPANVAVWDVTSPSIPDLITAFAFTTSDRNDRSYFRTDFALEPGRAYKIVARVSSLRGSLLPGALPSEPLKVFGGLSFMDLDPSSGVAVVQAQADPEHAYMALRYTAPIEGPVTVESAVEVPGGGQGTERDPKASRR